MSLRANTYAALVGAAFLAIAFVFAATIYAARVWIQAGERLAAASAMAQVLRATDAELTTMDRSARDWGSWTDAVEFANHRDPDFAGSNFTPSTLGTLDLDTLVMYDEQGRPLAQLHSSELTSDTAALRALGDATVPGSRLLRHTGSSGTQEIIRIGELTMLIVSRPIMASDESGPVQGTVVMGRLLNADRLGRIGMIADVPVAAYSPDDPAIPDRVSAELAAAPATGRISVQVKRPIDMIGFVRLDDHAGRSVLVLSAARTPLFYGTALRTIAALLGVFLIGGLIWALLSFNIVEATSLSRISWLNEAILRIGERGDFAERVDVGGSAPLDEAGQVAVAVNGMLAALERAHRQVLEGEQRHRVLVENMADAVLTLSPDGVFTYANPHAEHLLGVSQGDLVGRSYSTVLAGESIAAVGERVARGCEEALKTLEIMFVDASGRVFPVELSVSPIRDEDGSVASIHWIARDVTERRRFEEQLIHFANHDHLTGLFNRRRFEEEIAQRMAETRRHGRGGALLWLDIDHFKEINDNYGHATGDDVLACVASVLTDRSREEQALSRLGGDEFAMLLPFADGAEAVLAAERVLRELNRGVPLSDGRSVQVKGSVGIALFPEHATSVDELLLRADIAMYRAKESGRNSVSVFSPGEDWPEQLVNRRAWAERIERALAEDRFRVFAQPILDVKTSQYAGYELLVRMEMPDGTLCGPDEFLIAAEDVGLVTAIDRWMVSQAVRLAGLLGDSHPDQVLFVNLSAKTLADSGFPAFVADLLESSGVPATRLGLELTETALVSNMARARDFVESLRGLGCRFALDDYGSGFSSLSYLRHMPVDILKIDGSLIRELRTSEQDRHLVRAIIELARCLDIAVTGEYVESEETLAILLADGMDYAQGYYIGRPQPADELLEDEAPTRTQGGAAR